jgi:hypothetical protein
MSKERKDSQAYIGPNPCGSIFGRLLVDDFIETKGDDDNEEEDTDPIFDVVSDGKQGNKCDE